MKKWPEPLKIHAGCGTVHLPKPWINCDRRYVPGVDLVTDIGLLREFQEGTVTEIYACHALDHFDRWTYPRVLKRWFDLLKPGGVLQLSMSDWKAIVERYRETGDLKELWGLLYAGQDYPDNVRHFIFDFETLYRELRDIGFATIDRYDWRETEHADIDDFSKAYLPHGDKNGRLMSLNVIARK